MGAVLILSGLICTAGSIFLCLFRLIRRRRLGNLSASRSHITGRLGLFCKACIGNNLPADALYRIRGHIVLIAEQEPVKLDYIFLKSLRDDAVSLFPHLGFPSGAWEPGAITHMELRQCPRYRKQVTELNTGRDLWVYTLDDIINRRPVGFLKLLKSKGNNLPLPLGSRIVRIHKPEPSVSHCLDTVQMVHPRLFQMDGIDPRRLDRFGDEGINIVKLRLTYLHINAAQDIDGVRHRFPVKCGVIVYIQIQVLVQRFYSLFGTALQVCRIDFIV